MPDKQKVTLYISDELHRQFKIRSAVDGETMSSMAQRALEFYLTHSDLVQSGVEAHGKTHQIHNCPQCDASVTLSGGDLTLIQAYGDHTSGLAGDDFSRGLTGLEHIPALANQAVAQQPLVKKVLPGDVPGEQGDSSQTAQPDSRSPDEGELITC